MKKWSTKPDYWAECADCDWQSVARNAVGTAAIHAKRHGHYVRVQKESAIIFDGREEPDRASG